MKRINVFWLSLLMALTALPVSAFDFEIDGIKYDITGANEVCVSSGGDKNTEVVVIPSEVTNDATTYSVTAIGEKAFSFGLRAKLTSVTIPASIKKIGSRAFFNNKQLAEIHISDVAEWCDIEFTDAYANPLNYASLYLNGEKITELIIPEGVNVIKKYAFTGYSDLTSVDIPTTLKTFEEKCFDKCSNLTKINIHDIAAWCNVNMYNWSEINTNPLSFVHDLYLDGEMITDLVIPDGVTAISNYAFYGCSMTSVTIPGSVKEIWPQAFAECTNLTSVHIHDIAAWCGIKFIDNTANPLLYAHNLYLNGKKVTDLVIPNGVTSIERYAFYGLNDVTSVKLPASLTKIGNNAFSCCNGLTEITIPNNVTSIEEGAFTLCSDLTSAVFEDGETTLRLYAKIFASTPLEKVYIGRISDNNTQIGPFALAPKLSQVTIGNTVTSLGTNLFSGCTGLTSVHIPNNITFIGSYCFEGCTKLASIDIPNSVNLIGNNCFDGCTGLTSVTIPNSITFIAENCFRGCTGLTSITIPNSITHIDAGCFRDCTGLTSITIPNGVTDIGGSCFYGCTGLTSVTIPDGVTDIGGSCFYGCTGLTSITIPNSVTYISGECFRDCTGLTSITIPDGVKSIVGEAFRGCTGLTSVDIPASVTSIERDAFTDCTGLTAVNIHDMAAWCNIHPNFHPLHYAHNLYLNGELVTDLVIPDGVTSDMQNSFSDCTSLTSVVIPNSVTSIGGLAFYNCTNLSKITIPNSVTDIRSSAFVYTYNLMWIYVLNTTPPTSNDGTVFDDYSYRNATLYVPKESVEAYQTTAPWKYFTNIQGIDVSGIKDVKADVDARQNTCYDLNGRKLNGPKTGLNIINGKKVMVKNEK